MNELEFCEKVKEKLNSVFDNFLISKIQCIKVIKDDLKIYITLLKGDVENTFEFGLDPDRFELNDNCLSYIVLYSFTYSMVEA